LSAILLVDTSVAVALAVRDHEHHQAVLDRLSGRRLGLAGHAAFETFSVLSRLPPPGRRTAATVARLLAANFPNSRFLGADAAATSESTAREAARLGAPTNIVYVGDAGRPLDGAVLGAAVARGGGLLLLTRGGDVGQARNQLRRLGLLTRLDRLVVLGAAGRVTP